MVKRLVKSMLRKTKVVKVMKKKVSIKVATKMIATGSEG
jgi:hypothetical protein